MLNSTSAENALTECKKIKAVTRIAAQVNTMCLFRTLIYSLCSTSAMDDKDVSNHHFTDIILERPNQYDCDDSEVSGSGSQAFLSIFSRIIMYVTMYLS